MSNPNLLVEMVNKTIDKLDSTTIEKLQTWGKVVQLTIDNEDYYIDFRKIKETRLIKGEDSTFDFKLSTTSNIFNQIIHNELNPVEAVVSGEVAIEGSLTDALEFSEIMTANI